MTSIRRSVCKTPGVTTTAIVPRVTLRAFSQSRNWRRGTEIWEQWFRILIIIMPSTDKISMPSPLKWGLILTRSRKWSPSWVSSTSPPRTTALCIQGSPKRKRPQCWRAPSADTRMIPPHRIQTEASNGLSVSMILITRLIITPTWINPLKILRCRRPLVILILYSIERVSNGDLSMAVIALLNQLWRRRSTKVRGNTTRLVQLSTKTSETLSNSSNSLKFIKKHKKPIEIIKSVSPSTPPPRTPMPPSPSPPNYPKSKKSASPSSKKRRRGRSRRPESRRGTWTRCRGRGRSCLRKGRLGRSRITKSTREKLKQLNVR